MKQNFFFLRYVNPQILFWWYHFPNETFWLLIMIITADIDLADLDLRFFLLCCCYHVLVELVIIYHIPLVEWNKHCIFFCYYCYGWEFLSQPIRLVVSKPEPYLKDKGLSLLPLTVEYFQYLCCSKNCCFLSMDRSPPTFARY